MTEDSSEASSFISPPEFLDLRGFGGVCVHCRFNLSAYDDILYSRYDIAFAPQLRAAKATRRAEYLAGRMAVKYAFLRLGLTPKTVSIGPHRNPVWPSAVVGSISHHQSRVFCMLVRDSPNRPTTIYPGIDFESFIREDEILSLGSSIVSDAELQLIGSKFSRREQGLSLVFSAKESLFKGLYPAVSTYFDFLDVTVLSINVDRGELQLALAYDLSPTFLKGCSFTVYWQINNGAVLSWICPE